MSRIFARTALMLMGGSAVTILTAGGNPIGMAVANGSFQLDHAPVWGNTTLFDGSSIETTKASSQLQLNNGVVMRLAVDARATVHQRKLILERGSGQMESAAGYEVEAHSLHIFPATNDTVTRIKVESHTVQVAAIHGAVNVTNSTGLLVATIKDGTSLNFNPQDTGGATPTRASGCLLTKAGKLILSEQTTNVILELQGPGLDSQTGNRVEIIGMATTTSPTVSGASQLIQVTEVKLIAKGGCGAIAKKLGAAAGAGGAAAATAGVGGAAGAAGAAGAGTAVGIGIGTVAVIGGVATAAAVGGLAASGTFSSAAPAASR